MSDADRERAMWEAIGGGDIDADNLSREELVSTVEQMAADLLELQERVDREVPKLHNRIADVDRKAEGKVKTNGTTLHKFADMPPARREDTLGKTDRLAVAIHQNWDDIAERFGNGRYGVSTRRDSTAKYNPSLLKGELERRVSDDLLNPDGELPWVNIHRAMMAAAELSGGEPEQQTESDRKRITGGVYEYREHRVPNNRADRTYKVLVEAE